MDGALELPEGTLWELHNRDGQEGKDASFVHAIICRDKR